MFMDVRAAELAEGSVVATRNAVCIRVKGYPQPWLSTGRFRLTSHETVDALLADDATVLRNGTGEEVEV